MAVWTVVVAGGSGSRVGGDLPKQYLRFGEGRVLDASLRAARAVSDGVVLVVGAAFAARHEPLADVVVVGGDTRSASVRAGLAAVPDDDSVDVVLIHDAARPMATPDLFGRVVAAVRDGADAVVPGVAVTDTIKRVRDGVVVETPARDDLVAVQTPQGFRPAALRAAHAGGAEATDEAGLVERGGGRVVVVAGEIANRKVTTPDDLAVMGIGASRPAGVVAAGE
jgi:2-C-methyl-D-erythritol 4-phosphate cytidylyltransferase